LATCLNFVRSPTLDLSIASALQSSHEPHIAQLEFITTAWYEDIHVINILHGGINLSLSKSNSIEHLLETHHPIIFLCLQRAKQE
jgi:hypothetical protein